MKGWIALSFLLCIASAEADIPFYDQKQNAHEGNRTCAITSMAMVLDFYKITDPVRNNKRTPDWLYERFGVVQDEWELQALFNKLARDASIPVRDHFFEKGTLEQLRHRAKTGAPTVVHGWFTDSGHLLVVTGFDAGHYIVHDPYGRWLGKKYEPTATGYDHSVNGRGLRYPQEAFEYAINDNGTGDDLWLHIFDMPK